MTETNNSVMIIDERVILDKDFKMYGTVQEPLFLAKDVAEWIEYDINKVGQMLNAVDEDEKLTTTIYRSGQKREMWFLTENGLYEVLMQSRKPIAKQFKKEVKKILQSIRKTGGYVGNDDMFINNYLSFADDNTKQLFKLTLSTINQLNRKIEADKPMVEFATKVSDTSSLIDMSQMAKLLHDENIKIGRNKLFKWLQVNGFLRSNNEPYQQYINQGYFRVREYTYNTPYGEKVGIKTYITGKGQIYITEKLREEYA